MRIHCKSAITAALCFGLIACSGSGDDPQGHAAAGGQPPQMPPTKVKVEVLKAQTLTDTRELAGRARAYREAEIRPQVSGIIEKRFFEGGEDIKEGAALFQIAQDEYRAAVASARAALASAQTAARAAGETANRLKRLVDSGAVSRQQYDTAKASYDQARAGISLQQSQLTSAQINLDRTTIRAPISGSISRPNVTIGALITANQPNALAIVTQLDPIYIDMTVPSVDLLEYRQQVASGELKSTGDGKVPVKLILENGTTYAHEGKLEIVETRIEESAGTVTVRAVVPNPDRTLLPGAFVRARVVAGKLENAISIPQAALVRTPRGDATVYVVTADNQLEQRPVKLGPSIDNRWVIRSGLKDGERIAVSNLVRLGPGMPVDPEPVDAPAAPAAGAGTNPPAQGE